MDRVRRYIKQPPGYSETNIDNREKEIKIDENY